MRDSPVAHDTAFHSRCHRPISLSLFCCLSLSFSDAHMHHRLPRAHKTRGACSTCAAPKRQSLSASRVLTVHELVLQRAPQLAVHLLARLPRLPLLLRHLLPVVEVRAAPPEALPHRRLVRRLRRLVDVQSLPRVIRLQRRQSHLRRQVQVPHPVRRGDAQPPHLVRRQPRNHLLLLLLVLQLRRLVPEARLHVPVEDDVVAPPQPPLQQRPHVVAVHRVHGREEQRRHLADRTVLAAEDLADDLTVPCGVVREVDGAHRVAFLVQARHEHRRLRLLAGTVAALNREDPPGRRRRRQEVGDGGGRAAAALGLHKHLRGDTQRLRLEAEAENGDLLAVQREHHAGQGASGAAADDQHIVAVVRDVEVTGTRLPVLHPAGGTLLEHTHVRCVRPARRYLLGGQTLREHSHPSRPGLLRCCCCCVRAVTCAANEVQIL
eukprot:Rhum_TRINITY_DN10437_c0_g1::Rhum_TRINITY_DN10437_c0_g1_i1::g.38483::m.38483